MKASESKILVPLIVCGVERHEANSVPQRRTWQLQWYTMVYLDYCENLSIILLYISIREWMFYAEVNVTVWYTINNITLSLLTPYTKQKYSVWT